MEADASYGQLPQSTRDQCMPLQRVASSPHLQNLRNLGAVYVVEIEGSGPACIGKKKAKSKCRRQWQIVLAM